MGRTLLVEGRECGECTVCCVDLTIDDPELIKLPGVSCKNLKKDGGCKVYKTRPKTCIDFECMWKFLPNLDESWRPDNKGILIVRNLEELPEGYKDKISMDFYILKKDAINNLEFLEVIGGYILNGFACYLSYGPPEHVVRKILLNDLIYDAFATSDLLEIKRIINDCLDKCIKAPKNKLKIDNGTIVGLPVA